MELGESAVYSGLDVNVLFHKYPALVPVSAMLKYGPVRDKSSAWCADYDMCESGHLGHVQ
jgi:hypothetical protein